MGKSNSKNINIVSNIIESEPSTPLEYAICYIVKSSMRIVFMKSKELNNPNKIITSRGCIVYDYGCGVLSLYLNQNIEINDKIQKITRLNINDDILTIHTKIDAEDLEDMFLYLGKTNKTVREISSMF